MFPHSAVRFYNVANDITSRSPDPEKRSQTEALEARLDRANLIIQTLLMLLLEKQVIHEEEFKEWMVYVDELDGVRDGKVREDHRPNQCPECQRMSPRNSPKCIYCGHVFDVDFLARRPQRPQ